MPCSLYKLIFLVWDSQSYGTIHLVFMRQICGAPFRYNDREISARLKAIKFLFVVLILCENGVRDCGAVGQ
jgi:hypothetical protein